MEDGYSLDGQLEELREFAEARGYQVLEEVVDRGEKRWTLERPGIDRIKELASADGVDLVIAWRWDRFGEVPWPEVLALELSEHGTTLSALDALEEGEDAEVLRYLKGYFAKRERKRTPERSLLGKRKKVRRGKVLGAAPWPKYGFRHIRGANGKVVGYEIDEETMPEVLRVFRMLGEEGVSLHGVVATLEADGVPPPAVLGAVRKGKKPITSGYWSRTTIRDGIVLDDLYRPHPFEEVAELVSPEVAQGLDPQRSYGILWWGQKKTRYESWRSKKRVAKTTDRSEWIAVPVDLSGSGLTRELVDRARKAVESHPRI